MSLIIRPGEEDAPSPDRWELIAVAPRRWFDQTNTQPLLIDARRGDSERGRWVLKPVARLTIPDSIKELVAYRLADLCGISIPEYGVVHVVEPRVRHLPEPACSILSDSLGPNFATRFIPGLSDVIDTLAVPPGLRSTGCDIFAFDVGVDNVDRRQDNSNLLLGDDVLVAIDHQHTFSWCVPGNEAEEWTRRILHRIVRDHFFGNVVFRWLESYARLRESGQAFDADTAAALTDNLPEEWLARGGEEYRQRIRAYLVSLFAAWEEMLDQIEGHAAA